MKMFDLYVNRNVKVDIGFAKKQLVLLNARELDAKELPANPIE